MPDVHTNEYNGAVCRWVVNEVSFSLKGRLFKKKDLVLRVLVKITLSRTRESKTEKDVKQLSFLLLFVERMLWKLALTMESCTVCLQPSLRFDPRQVPIGRHAISSAKSSEMCADAVFQARTDLQKAYCSSYEENCCQGPRFNW